MYFGRVEVCINRVDEAAGVAFEFARLVREGIYGFIGDGEAYLPGDVGEESFGF